MRQKAEEEMEKRRQAPVAASRRNLLFSCSTVCSRSALKEAAARQQASKAPQPAEACAVPRHIDSASALRPRCCEILVDVSFGQDDFATKMMKKMGASSAMERLCSV